MTEQSLCPHCEGTGWKTVERDGVSGVERCDCALSERVRRLEQKANIPPLCRDSSFDNFSTLPDNPVVNRVLSTAAGHRPSVGRPRPPTWRCCSCWSWRLPHCARCCFARGSGPS